MNNNKQIRTRVAREVEPEWQHLMVLAEQIQFGEFRVIVKNGKPVRAEQIVKSIELDKGTGELETLTI